MAFIKGLFLAFCTLFVTVESIVTYENTISVQKITRPSGLIFKPNTSKNLTLIANKGCSICFRFMLKQHDHVTLVRIGQSNSKFEMEIFIERDDKAIFQVRTRVVYDRVRKRKKYFEIPAFLQIERGKS